MSHHVYEGRREGENGIPHVTCDGHAFYHYLSLAVCNHSPTGFEWGYGGSGPAQLALALLLEAVDEETAVELHQAYKWEVIAGLNRFKWMLTTRMIINWVEKQLDLLPPNETLERE